MIDIHAHLIPAVDDGCRNIGEALAIIGEMSALGITDVICTPHHNGKYVFTTDELRQKFRELKDAVIQSQIPVNIYLGTEIFYSKHSLSLLDNKEVLTLNDTEYVLVEFNTDGESEIIEAVYSLKRRGYIPIVAHFERYKYADAYTAYDIIRTGGLISVNAASVIKGHAKYKYVKSLIKQNYVQFVASDVHFERSNFMADAYKSVKRKFKADVADALFTLNASNIIKG